MITVLERRLFLWPEIFWYIAHFSLLITPGRVIYVVTKNKEVKHHDNQRIQSQLQRNR